MPSSGSLMRFTCEKVTEARDELAEVIKGQVFFSERYDR